MLRYFVAVLRSNLHIVYNKFYFCVGVVEKIIKEFVFVFLLNRRDSKLQKKISYEKKRVCDLERTL